MLDACNGASSLTRKTRGISDYIVGNMTMVGYEKITMNTTIYDYGAHAKIFPIPAGPHEFAHLCLCKIPETYGKIFLFKAI